MNTPPTTTTWNNPLRSLSRTSSRASTVSSVAEENEGENSIDKKETEEAPQEPQRITKRQQSPPASVSVSTTNRIPASDTASVFCNRNDTNNNNNNSNKDTQEQVEHLPEKFDRMIPTSATSNFLVGKLALVTGGSGTIGVAIAKALVKNKASVVLTGRNVNRLKTAAESVRAACPEAPENSVKLVSCDVSQEDSVEKLFHTLDVDKDKRVDILINNAGMNIPGATEDLTAKDFEQVMAVNVLGPFLCSREVMKRMKSSGLGGRIINIGSLSAHCSRHDSAPYTTSKFALRGLTESLALDGRPHKIAVGMIHPGNVQSELLTPEMVAEREHEGFLQPEQVADCVVQMASLPYWANIQEMTVLPTAQPFVGRG